MPARFLIALSILAVATQSRAAEPFPNVAIVDIDYILANEMFLANWTKNNGPPPGATVVKTNETEHTSDHYPIQLVA